MHNVGVKMKKNTTKLDSSHRISSGRLDQCSDHTQARKHVLITLGTEFTEFTNHCVNIVIQVKFNALLSFS